jgi:squalene-associated FAD-dependent desaturase
MAPTRSSGSVVVIGGGLAGLTAAIELASAGVAVTVLEARPWLGGATFSFARRGLTIDNGQHLFLGCSAGYREFLARLGTSASASLQPALDLTVLGPDGEATVRPADLPPPFHLATSLAGYSLLSAGERVKAAAAAATLLVTARAGRLASQASLGDWLPRHFQDAHARQVFWDVLTASVLNVSSGRADLVLTAGALSLLTRAGRDGAGIGVPAVPLSQLHGEPAAQLLGRLRVEVRLGVEAVALQSEPGGGFTVRLGYADPGRSGQDGEPPLDRGPGEITAAAVVLAVPAWEAARLAPAELAADAARWARLEPAPVISLHVVFGEAVTSLPFAVAVGPPVHWVVDKTGAAGLRTGQYLAVCVPAADDYVDLPVSRLRAEFLARLAQHFPAAAHASVEDFFVTRERKATIRPVPGCELWRTVRPGALPGLAVAGAWTATGWPDSMEAAVRSGHTAARQLLDELSAGAATAASTGAMSMGVMTGGTSADEIAPVLQLSDLSARRAARARAGRSAAAGSPAPAAGKLASAAGGSGAPPAAVSAAAVSATGASAPGTSDTAASTTAIAATVGWPGDDSTNGDGPDAPGTAGTGTAGTGTATGGSTGTRSGPAGDRTRRTGADQAGGAPAVTEP